MSGSRWLLPGVLGLATAAALLAGCTRGDSIEAALARGSLPEALAAYDALPEADPERLRPIAERLLHDAALAEDASLAERAFAELRLAGTRGRRVLEQLALASDPSRAARAWQGLAALGDGDARDRLRELLHSESSELRALALEAEPEPEPERVRAALGAAQAELRRAGVQAARRLASRSGLEPVLIELVRLDPDPGVRAAAALALTAAGDAAAGALDAALQDPVASVRSAALDALWAVAPERAELRVARLWGTDPGSESLEAARRALGAGVPPERAARAREHLLRGLSAAAFALRAQAAVALAADLTHVGDALAAQLAVERVPSVRLALALALGPPRASTALEELSAGADVAAAEAAAALARHSQQAGLERLRALRSSRLAAVRRVAYTALGRELGRVSELRAGLSDADAGVRLACAGAVLTGRAVAVSPTESS
jgi:hypothetical protein